MSQRSPHSSDGHGETAHQGSRRDSRESPERPFQGSPQIWKGPGSRRQFRSTSPSRRDDHRPSSPRRRESWRSTDHERTPERRRSGADSSGEHNRASKRSQGSRGAYYPNARGHERRYDAEAGRSQSFISFGAVERCASSMHILNKRGTRRLACTPTRCLGFRG